MTGPLVMPAQAATFNDVVTQYHIATALNADRQADSGWYHGLWANNTLEDPSKGVEDVSLVAVGAAGTDESKLNGSLEMTRTATQLSRIE